MQDTSAPKSKPMLLSADEVAAQCSVSRRTVFEWISAGKIRSVKVSRCRRIPAAEVAKIIRRGI